MHVRAWATWCLGWAQPQQWCTQTCMVRNCVSRLGSGHLRRCACPASWLARWYGRARHGYGPAALSEGAARQAPCPRALGSGLAVCLAHRPPAREFFCAPITALHAKVCVMRKNPTLGMRKVRPFGADVVGVLEDWRTGKATVHAPIREEAIVPKHKHGAPTDEPPPLPPI